MNDFKPPIIAPSTSVASDSAISILRISGKIVLDDFQKYFLLDLQGIKERYCYFTKILSGNLILDEIILVYFKGPASFTGEDILEIHIHGNRLNIKNILNLFIKNGLCKMAKKGEFAHRAFLNKKMTLIQAEGLERLINAKTPLALSSGMSLLNGKLSQDYTNLYQNFLKLKSAFEIGIDFYEDVGEEGYKNNLAQAILLLSTSINDLYIKAKHFNKEFLTPHVAVFGIPNAGKSSFFNCILNFERSIVSDIPGTTRDYVSEYLEFDSALVKLVDTAGIRNATDEIEKKGIVQTLELYSKSLFKILIVNPLDIKFFNDAGPIIDKTFDLVIFSHCEGISSIDVFIPFIRALNSSSFLFCSFLRTGPIGPVSLFSESGPRGPIIKKAAGPIGPLPCFNKITFDKNVNLYSSGPIGPEDNLLKLIEKIILDKISQVSPDGVVAERHVAVIEQLHDEWTTFLAKSSKLEDVAIVLSELVLVEESIAELVGQIVSEQVLNNIFDNFCIGK